VCSSEGHPRLAAQQQAVGCCIARKRTILDTLAISRSKSSQTFCVNVSGNAGPYASQSPMRKPYPEIPNLIKAGQVGPLSTGGANPPSPFAPRQIRPSRVLPPPLWWVPPPPQVRVHIRSSLTKTLVLASKLRSKVMNLILDR
jgi:hypothetical protein